MHLTEEQLKCTELALDALKSKPVVAIDGPAGSGKTTLIRYLYDQLRKQGHTVIVTAITRRAVQVLRSKGIPAANTMYSTCFNRKLSVADHKVFDHLQKIASGESFIEPPVEVKEYLGPTLLRRAEQSACKYGMEDALRIARRASDDEWTYTCKKPQDGILIIDEASMLSYATLTDVCRVFSKVIVIGDAFQLPPTGKKHIASCLSSVKPRYSLTTIMRQPADSQALTLALNIRNGKKVSLGQHTLDELMPLIEKGVKIITFTNQRREYLNNVIRQKLGFTTEHPQAGEPLVCLHQFDKSAFGKGLTNGSFWTVLRTSEPYVCTLSNDHTKRTLACEPIYLVDEHGGYGSAFEYAYCLTAHSAQGGEFDYIIIDKQGITDYQKTHAKTLRNWLYTAATRARKKVYMAV